MNNKSWFSKCLVVGIILLFIGVGIQPAFAIDISNNSPSKNIEDCNCQVADNFDIVRVKSLLNRAERSLNRVEIFAKLIPVLSKENPEVLEYCEGLSEKINTFMEMIDEEISEQILLYSSQFNDEICDMLDSFFLITFDTMLKLAFITEHFERDSIIYNILGSFVGALATFGIILLFLLENFNCGFPPIPL